MGLTIMRKTTERNGIALNTAIVKDVAMLSLDFSARALPQPD